MELWRKEARKHNIDATREALREGDIPPGTRLKHQGRKNKSRATIEMKVPSAALVKLLANVGLYNKEEIAL